jgi:predicted nucleotidyltransferase component of viral defense system
MIPREFITAWRSRVPWALDEQVEQDLVISRALVEIFSDGGLAEGLAFRGGTALHKVVFAKPLRYSEDIDLVRTGAGPAGDIIDALRAKLDPWLGKPKRERKDASVKLIYRFESEIPPVVPLRLKVEINTREHAALLPRTRTPFEVESGWFRGHADVNTFALPELLGTKLRALYQRKKGRDLFDMDAALRMLDEEQDSEIVRCFLDYLGRGGLKVSRAEFEENLHDKRGDAAFGEDIRPLLAHGVTFDRAHAFDTILSRLVARLPGEPWQPAPPTGAKERTRSRRSE